MTDEVIYVCGALSIFAVIATLLGIRDHRKQGHLRAEAKAQYLIEREWNSAVRDALALKHPEHQWWIQRSWHINLYSLKQGDPDATPSEVADLILTFIKIGENIYGKRPLPEGGEEVQSDQSHGTDPGTNREAPQVGT